MSQIAMTRDVAPPSAAVIAEPRRRRVVLLQTQAEAAGAQEISRLVAAGLAARGCTVHQVFLFRRTGAFDGDRHTVLCAPERPRNVRDLLRMLGRLHRELRRLRPDAVICFQHFGNLIGGAFARVAGVPLVIANQNGLMDILSRPVIAADRVLGTLGFFSRIVVNSAQTEAEYRAHPASYRRRLVRIDHGFGHKRSDLRRDEARASFGLAPDAVWLGCVARLHPNKRAADAIRLLPSEPGWHLALAGQGEAREELEALATRLGCRDRVAFLGELSSKRVGDLLAALDVFVFPSASESFGLAPVEAAAAGVPVVANRLPVLAEVLAHDGRPAALLVDTSDPAVFAAAVRRVLAEPALARALTAAGRRLGERYPLEDMVEAYAALVRGRPAIPVRA